MSGYREYRDENDLLQDFRQHWANPENKRKLPPYIFNSLLDDVIMSIVADVHYQHKSGSLFALEGVKEEHKPPHENSTDVEKASCPNCDRVVAAARFAPHLEKCMGMGRNSARVSSRRIASRGEGTSYFGNVVSDDEDDADWSGEKKRGDKKKLPKLSSTSVTTKKPSKSS